MTGSYSGYGHEGCVGGWGDKLQDAKVGGCAYDLCCGVQREI